MTTIPIHASRSYEVKIESGSLEQLGAFTAAVTGVCTAMVVSDDTVYRLYGHRAEESLRKAGFQVKRFVFPHGEAQKTLDTYGALLQAMLVSRLTRSDILVALGGGVVGDLAGFAAATYQRGIRFVQVPTTLLAAVDSSVGGKTAVDLPGGKNQVGAFWQPSLVLCDPSLLQTLPPQQYRCGCAEVIKYALLQDADFFRSLLQTPICRQYEIVIAACVAKKRDIVEEDEFDRGRRQLLNLGHTVGHAVEACADFEILHGQAVAIGMAVITRAACRRGLCDGETVSALEQLLRAYELPITTELPAQCLFDCAMTDKKRSGDTLHLIVPEAIGHCRIESIAADTLLSWLHDGGII